MIDEAKNTSLIAEWFDYIEAPQAREAFAYLVGLSAVSRDFRCHAQLKGEVRDFRFFASNDELLFAMIPNKHWLLFYFRKPAIASGKFNVRSLQNAFDVVQENASGEWTIRIRCTDDVKRLWPLLQTEVGT